MSEADRQDIEKRLPFFSGKVCLLSLQAFDTEQQFSYQIRFVLISHDQLCVYGHCRSNDLIITRIRYSSSHTCNLPCLHENTNKFRIYK